MIYFFPSDNQGLGQLGSFTVSETLNVRTDLKTLVTSQFPQPEEIKKNDILIFQGSAGSSQRIIWNNYNEVKGISRIYMLSANPFDIPKEHQIAFDYYDKWKQQNMLEMMGEADRVIVHTKFMRDRLGELGISKKRIKVIPTYLPAIARTAYSTSRSPDSRRILCNWSTSYLREYQIIKPIIGKKNTRWFISCAPEEDFDNIERLHQLPWVPFSDYYSMLAGGYYDIGLNIRLEDNFNRARTYMKSLDYSLLGIPSITSEWNEDPNSFVRVGNDPKEILWAIEYLLNDQDYYDYIVQRQFDNLKDKWLSRPENYGKWVNLFNSL
jgi:hypothetical protein